MAMTGLCIVLKYDNLTPALAGLAMSFAIQVLLLRIISLQIYICTMKIAKLIRNNIIKRPNFMIITVKPSYAQWKREQEKPYYCLKVTD